MSYKEKTEPKEIELIPGSPLLFKLADWFSQHGQKMIYGAVVVVLVLIVGLVWSQQRKGASEKAYVDAEVSYNNFFRLASEQADPANDQPFLTLKDILKDHLELGPRYDGAIAQVFLRVGAMDPALIYGDKALKRLAAENFPSFEEFSKTSLLIVQGSDQEALKRALFLQKKMIEAGSTDVLTLFNQIRLAMLYGRLGNKDEEIKAWNQWDQWVTTNPSAAQALADGFKTGKVTLADYIAARKKNLGYTQKVTQK